MVQAETPSAKQPSSKEQQSIVSRTHQRLRPPFCTLSVSWNFGNLGNRYDSGLDITSSTNNVNDRVLRSDIDGTRYEDDYKDIITMT